MGQNCWTHLDNGQPKLNAWVFALDVRDSDFCVKAGLEVPILDDVFYGKYIGSGRVEIEQDSTPVKIGLWHYVPALSYRNMDE